MTVNWSPLNDALARYRNSRKTLSVWWRDDDAIKPTPALDRLQGLSEKLRFEVNIAVIPARATPELAALTRAAAQLVPLVHGYRHENHAPEDQKKSEFGTPRVEAAQDVSAGIDRMRRIFGEAFLPVFVPPWNRVAPQVIATLPQAGFRGLSTFTARKTPYPAPGLVQINTHIDPIDWKNTRDLKDPDHIIAETCAHLAARLAGNEDATEPLGYLTHHLDHTDALWEFSERFLNTLLDGGAHVQPLAPLLETTP